MGMIIIVANDRNIANTSAVVLNVATVYAVKMNGSASNVSDNTNTITAVLWLKVVSLNLTYYVWNTGNTTDRI